MASATLFQRGNVAARWNSNGAGLDGSGPHYEVTFADGRVKLYDTEDEAVRAARRAANRLFPDPKRLAAEYARQLFACLSVEEWFAMRRRNRADADKPDICHSHDYVDANMVMEGAWRTLMRDKHWALADEASQPALLEAECEVWNRAWEIAKAKYLTDGASR